MRLSELPEGARFTTKLTRRKGRVEAHTQDRGVIVRWDEQQNTAYIHPDCDVDES